MIVNKETKDNILNLFNTYFLRDKYHIDIYKDELKKIFPKDIYKNMSFHKGVTKMVFIFEGADYVIKIPFNGTYVECENDKEKFVYFTESDNTEREWDYCYTEVDLYDRAEDWSIQNLFAKTELLGTLANGYPIYVQERCTPWSTYLSEQDSEELYRTLDFSDEEREEIRTLSNSYDAVFENDLAEDWLLMINNCCEEHLEELLSFLDDAYIRDLHEDNFGLRWGKPIIFDYSGYNE